MAEWFEKVNEQLTPLAAPAQAAGSNIFAGASATGTVDVNGGSGGATPAGGGGGAGGGTGGPMRIDESALDEIKKELEDILVDLDGNWQSTEFLSKVVPPGADPASNAVTKRMNESGEGYAKSYAEQYNQVRKLHAAVTSALNDYRGVEQDSTDATQQVNDQLHEKGGL